MIFMYQVLELVKSCPSPWGATSDYVEEKTGKEFERVSRALQKLRGKGLLFSTRGYGESHYFVSEAALEAALPAVQTHAAIKRQAAKEAEKAYQSARFRTEEYRAKAREYARQRYAGGYRSPVRTKESKPGKELVVPSAPKPSIQKGPAYLSGDLVITANTKITIAPTPPDPRRTTTYSVMA